MHAQKHVSPHESTSLSLDEAISAYLDGELPLDTDQLDHSYARQLWDNYHLIGDVMRSTDLAIKPSELFYARVAKAIDEEAVVFAPKATTKPVWRRWSAPVAAVVALAVVGLWGWQPTSIPTEAPKIAQAEDLWVDYIDAHRSMTGIGPASYVSYVDH